VNNIVVIKDRTRRINERAFMLCCCAFHILPSLRNDACDVVNYASKICTHITREPRNRGDAGWGCIKLLRQCSAFLSLKNIVESEQKEMLSSKENQVALNLCALNLHEV
jgi:hypothetical protein